jgi:hypothetical protein
LALREHDLKQMRELLDAQPALVGKGDKRSNQPIHWATMTRQLDAIDELLRRAADINAQRMDGARPIHVTNGDYFYRGWRDVPRNWPVTSAHVMARLRARGAFIDLPTACHTGDIDPPRARVARSGSVAGRLDHPFVREGRFASLLVRDRGLADSLAEGFHELWRKAMKSLREIQVDPRGHKS